MKCRFEHRGDCCNSGSPWYLSNCEQPCDAIIPMTNADRIRAMSDRELASFLAKYAVSGSNLRLIDLGYQPTATELEVLHEQLATTWMRWLRQPAENNETVTDCHR